MAWIRIGFGRFSPFLSNLKITLSLKTVQNCDSIKTAWIVMLATPVRRNLDLIFRVGGEGGEGVISTGELLTIALARSGYEIYTFRTYPAEIKGGHANYQVRVSDQTLLSQSDMLDFLLTFY